MKTKNQRPTGNAQTTTCRACGGKGYVEKGVKDGTRERVRCIQCGGSGKSGGYVTK